MAIHKLTSRFVVTVTEKGMYPDGGGLYLQVGDGGKAKSWIFRYHVEGRGDRQMGLGPLNTIGLAEARDRAEQCRVQRLDGIDPIEARKLATLAQEQKAAKQVTFQTCAEEWVERNSQAWNPGTLDNQKGIIRKHLNPLLGKLPVSAINIDLVEKTIAPIWETIPPHAKRTLKILKSILDLATAKGYREGDNPADLKGPIGIRLKPYVHAATHHASLPYQEIGAFMAQLRSRLHMLSGKRLLTSYALEFVILTAVRKHQVINLRWTDIDWDNKLWICENHKTRKKMKQPHIIPLSDQAMGILTIIREQQAADGTPSEYVFVHGPNRTPLYHRSLSSRYPKSPYPGKKISSSGLNLLLTTVLARPDLTVHGFRTTFSSWANDQGFPERDIEMALAHIVGNQIAQIYARNAKRLEPRRQLMEAWADYCDRTVPLDAKVISMRSLRSAAKE
jgi:integrase